MNKTEIKLKYEMQIDNAISECNQEIKKIRKLYKDDIVKEKVLDETKKLKVKSEQIQQNYIEELENYVNSIKKELKIQETIQKADKAKENLILKQLERSNNILEAMLILDSNNETAILSLIDKHKDNKEMLNLMKSKVEGTISDRINTELRDIEFNSIENQIQVLENSIKYEKTINTLSNKVTQAINEIDNPYF